MRNTALLWIGQGDLNLPHVRYFARPVAGRSAAGTITAALRRNLFQPTVPVQCLFRPECLLTRPERRGSRGRAAVMGSLVAAGQQIATGCATPGE